MSKLRSVTHHTPRFNFLWDRPVLDLTIAEGWKTELTLVLLIYRNSLPVRRQSPIETVITLRRRDWESNPGSRDRKSNV